MTSESYNTNIDISQEISQAQPTDPEQIYPDQIDFDHPPLLPQQPECSSEEEQSDNNTDTSADQPSTETEFVAQHPKPEPYSTDTKNGVSLPYPDDDAAPTLESGQDFQSYRMKNYPPEFATQVLAPEGAPNILLIMTDDVGFGASSTFGGPAYTPNMSKLQEEGLIYNHFHTTAVCSATRAALLTGRLPHNVATGYVVDSSTGYPGYYSQFPKSSSTIGQVLRMNGYSTAWFGKNHNTPTWQTSSSGPYDQWPTGLGFERFYGFMGGESDQYHPQLYDNTTPIEPALKPRACGEEPYHLDTDLADHCIDFIRSKHSLTPGKPWFAYYAPGATHAPHQVPQSYIAKYEDARRELHLGWDHLREKTLQNQKDLGIVPEETECSVRPKEIPAWEEFASNKIYKELYTRMIQVYCGFLEMTDHNIGRILDCVDEIGERENTLVIYIQGDNGGSVEGSLEGSTNELAAMINHIPEPENFLIRAKDELGSELHMNTMPVGWAWALNSPMQWAKQFASHFGGTRNGMVVRWPKKIKKDMMENNLRKQFLHIIDIFPTLLEAAGVKTPINSVNGFEQTPLDGDSFIKTFDPNFSKEVHQKMIFEMGGTFGLYNDGWMLSSTPKQFPWLPEIDETKEGYQNYYDVQWQLYNVANDYSQAYNVVSKEFLSTVDNTKKKQLLNLERNMINNFRQLAIDNQIFPWCANSTDRIYGMAGKPSFGALYGGESGQFVYHNKIIRIPEACAPACKNGSFCITVNIDKDPNVNSCYNGLIFSMGGRYCGFGLYVLDGRLQFIYKLAHWPSAIYRIDGPFLEPGRRTIELNFKYKNPNTLGGAGKFTLKVDPELKVSDKSGHAFPKSKKSCSTEQMSNSFSESVYLPSTVPQLFSITEGLNIGYAAGSPLDERYAQLLPFEFNGSIKKVIFVQEDTLPAELKKKLLIAESYIENDL